MDALLCLLAGSHVNGGIHEGNEAGRGEQEPQLRPVLVDPKNKFHEYLLLVGWTDLKGTTNANFCNKCNILMRYVKIWFLSH